jgi:hypothetical protein
VPQIANKRREKRNASPASRYVFIASSKTIASAVTQKWRRRREEFWITKL